jgi:hypothetical protein
MYGGNFTEQGLPVFSGGGQSQFMRSTLTLTTDVIPGLTMASGTLYLTPTFQGGSITNLTLSGMVLLGNNTLSGLFNWTGGSIGGSLTVAGSAVLNASGGGLKSLNGALTNYGTVNWSGGDWTINNNNGFYTGAVYNQPGGLFDVQCDQSLNNYLDGYDYHGVGYGFFNNAGTLRKSAGSGTTYFTPPLTNSATVEADAGIIYFQGGYFGSPSANLAISLGGSTPGTGFGRIQFSTPLNVDGSFNVSTRNGYLPNPGAAFQVLNYPSSTNSFTCLSGLDLGGGILLQPQFGPTGLTLLATTYTTNASQPQLFINRTLGGLAITWPVGFQGWALQSTTNLSSAPWSMVSNACVNQAVVPISAPQQYFRLIGN